MTTPVGECRSDKAASRSHYADSIFSNDFSHLATLIEGSESHLSKWKRLHCSEYHVCLTSLLSSHFVTSERIILPNSLSDYRMARLSMIRYIDALTLQSKTCHHHLIKRKLLLEQRHFKPDMLISLQWRQTHQTYSRTSHANALCFNLYSTAQCSTRFSNDISLVQQY
jgi:hypothetical protein